MRNPIILFLFDKSFDKKKFRPQNNTKLLLVFQSRIFKFLMITNEIVDIILSLDDVLWKINNISDSDNWPTVFE